MLHWRIFYRNLGHCRGWGLVGWGVVPIHHCKKSASNIFQVKFVCSTIVYVSVTQLQITKTVKMKIILPAKGHSAYMYGGCSLTAGNERSLCGQPCTQRRHIGCVFLCLLTTVGPRKRQFPLNDITLAVSGISV